MGQEASAGSVFNEVGRLGHFVGSLLGLRGFLFTNISWRFKGPA